MKGKRGSFSEWLFVVFLMLIIGGLVLFVSSNIFYKKADVYTKSEVENLLKNSCTYIEFEDDSYFGKTPQTVCENINMKPQFLVVREVVDVMSKGGEVVYRDVNYYVGDSKNVDISSVFSKPFGMAEDGETTYGNPSFENTGQTNTIASGLLCCR